MSKQKKASDKVDLEELEVFFRSAISERAAKGLSDTVCIALVIDEETFFFTRKKGKNHIQRKEPTRPDVYFWVPQNAMRHFMGMVKEPETNLGHIGVAIFERIFASDPTQRIKFRVNASFLSLFAKGYFSVLKAGGPEVASYLTRWGFNFAKIKDVLRKVRG